MKYQEAGNIEAQEFDTIIDGRMITRLDDIANLPDNEFDEYCGITDCCNGYPADPKGSPTYLQAYGQQYAREQEIDHESAR